MEFLYFRSIDCDCFSQYISFLAEKIEELETICCSRRYNRAIHVTYTIYFRLV